MNQSLLESSSTLSAVFSKVKIYLFIIYMTRGGLFCRLSPGPLPWFHCQCRFVVPFDADEQFLRASYFIFSWFLDTVPSSWPSHLRHLPVLLASFDGLAMDSSSPLISNASFNGNGTKINRLAEWAECGMSPQPRW
jgi:hypothetical protein